MRSQSSVASPLIVPFLALLLTLWISFNLPVSRATPVALVEREDIAERDAGLEKRTYFPDYPPSCQICEQHYSEIDSCANASIVFSDVATIMYNPLMFFSVIECACTDTFQSAYPQCVDCFEQTNQTVFLEPTNGQNLSSVITGMRQICALGSSIFGHVGSVNSELPGQTPITVASAGAAFRQHGAPGGVFVLFSEMMGWSGQGASALLVATLTIMMGMGMGVLTVL